MESDKPTTATSVADHYACTGDCGGVAMEPGTCQAPNCTQYEKPLVPCDCDSASHPIDEEAPAKEA
jgi:hypothetical protein